MRKIIVTGLIVAVCMLLIPLAANKGKKGEARTAAAQVTDAEKEPVKTEKSESISFRIKTADKILNLSAEDYLTGVVSAEMPVSFGKEALKAQCVAAYSFALYKKARATGDFDLTDSYKTDQSYLSETALKEKWGASFDNNIGAVKSAVQAVAGEYLSFGGEPALALYHSLSAGKTNSCADVFGSKLSYLVSVNSKSDALSPDCKSELSLGEKEVKEKLSLSSIPSKPLKITKTSDSGCVLKAEIADKSISGVKLAGLLGLPSPNFIVKYSSGTYIFECRGRGHGVGMSQYGAGQMAAAGSTYREILAHYYKGTTLQKS